MGWWGYDVMEGDTPLDCQGDIINFLADPELVEKYNSDEGDWKENMDAMHSNAFEALKTGDNTLNVYKAITSGELCGYNTDIALQVLGEMIMANGGIMDEYVRDACIKAANNEIETDGRGWVQEGERERCLKAYIARVIAYSGTPIEPMSKGLL